MLSRWTSIGTPRLLTLIGALALIIGAFLPWFSASAPGSGASLTRFGITGDGVVTSAIGVILLLISLLYKGQPGKRYSSPAFYLAALACLVGLLAYNAYNGLLPKAGTGIFAAIGSGIYLTLAGAFLAAIGTQLSTPARAASPSSTGDASPAGERK